ncbi:phage holin family protein [Novosphingobium flavum]|uniref:Phage holin family protein n=1 Tax=Novosphingobium flavum TaxID=1778672 RepID=A0A7X1FPS7_9SPHN|nr:phage holin family protein [Novosphingobium flavum]MBC2664759.1 phage holin family protein [Novosphingobium flavum]
MDAEYEPLDSAAEPVSPTGLAGLIDDLRRLGAEGRDYVGAELDYQASRARFAAGAAARIALFGLIALIVAVFALGALVVGLLMALATLVGPWWATLIVAGGLAVVALAFALAAKSGYSRAMRLILPRDEKGDV